MTSADGFGTPPEPERSDVRVLVADDQKVVRDGLAMLLGLLPGIDVVGVAIDGVCHRSTLSTSPRTLMR